MFGISGKPLISESDRGFLVQVFPFTTPSLILPRQVVASYLLIGWSLSHLRVPSIPFLFLLSTLRKSFAVYVPKMRYDVILLRLVVTSSPLIGWSFSTILLFFLLFTAHPL